MSPIANMLASMAIGALGAVVVVIVIGALT